MKVETTYPSASSSVGRPLRLFGGFCRAEVRPRVDEQQLYLLERERLDRLEEQSERFQNNNLLGSTTQRAPPNDHYFEEISPLSGNKLLFDPIRCSSQDLLDEMHFRFRSNPGVSERRNAIGHAMQRKSLMKGILSMSTKGERIPNDELKEGKKIPIYMANKEHAIPENCGQPLRELDPYYDDKTYIVLNKQGTIFRFSKAKSLFLLDSENPLRCAAVRLFIAPLFAHFITFVILCNCACMVLVQPPKWIEQYLEHLFTAIYIAEAVVKILARGFVIHRFSYLRDPWNWLDFIVIMTAIITEIVSSIQKVAVLRAFRVLRALKTMSIVPGLRAIVKALLRSIRALKDAVLLTIFCVSVFGLVGYQLFHGTMRQKCIRIGGTLEIPPDSLYLNLSTISNKPPDLFEDESRTWTSGEDRLHLLYRNWLGIKHHCALRPSRAPPGDEGVWDQSDARFLHSIVNNTNNTFITTQSVSRLSSNASWTQCVCQNNFTTSVLSNSTFLSISKLTESEMNGTSGRTNFDPGGSAPVTLKKKAETNNERIVKVDYIAANISCLHHWFNVTNTSEASQWFELMMFGSSAVPRWDTRQFIVLFRINSSSSSTNSLLEFPFLFYTELSQEEIKGRNLMNSWINEKGVQCKVEPKTGLFFPPGSPDRPLPEPIFCSMSNSGDCPPGYGCLEAGSNPDNNYTSFDHFFVAFLTSFRLVSLDAWGRLYFLTLHTAGPTYAIFYLLVVFLGSYYLVNLILAVVYMAYEEQQAVVEEEEVAAKEREEEEREMQQKEDVDEDESSEYHSEEESCSDEDEEPDIKLGLITTSLGSHDNSVSRGSFHLRNRRKKSSQHSIRYERNGNSDSVLADKFADGDKNQLQIGMHKRLCGVKSDSVDQVSEARRRKQGYFNGLGLKPPGGSKVRRRLSTPIIKLFATNQISNQTTTRRSGPLSTLVVPQLLMTPPSCNDLASSNDVEQEEVHSGGDDPSMDAKTIDLPIILPIGRLSESSSDEADQSEEEKHIVVDVEASTNTCSDNSTCSLTRHTNNESRNLPIISQPKDTMHCENEDLKSMNSDRSAVNTKSSEIDHSKTDCVVATNLNDPEKISFENGTKSREMLNLLQNGDSHVHSKKKKSKRKRGFHRLSKYFIDIIAKWKCLPPSLQPLQGWIREVVLNPFTDLLITICIALNALFLTAEHYPMDKSFESSLDNANLFFTVIFTVEMFAKIVGLSPYTYFRQRWNVFDAFVVFFSLLEYFVQTTGGFSVLRAFRLMRIIKLAKQWPILNKLLRIIGRTLGKLSHLTLVFLLVLYIFAVVGMQLLHNSYIDGFEGHDGESLPPRWNFIDFPHAFMVVFRIQCGEWVENMFVCLNVASPGICIPLFISVYVIGNLVILNLFLALLLNSFSGDVLQHTTSENNTISEAVKQAKMWLGARKKNFLSLPGIKFCQFLKIRFKSSSEKSTLSKNESLKRDNESLKRDNESLKHDNESLKYDNEPLKHEAELSFICDKKTRKRSSLNGHTKAMESSNKAGESSPIFSKRDSDIFLTVHHPTSSSPCSCYRFGSVRTSRSCSINSGASEWSYQSAPTRRIHRRSTRQIKTLARQRYRGESCCLDVQKEAQNPFKLGSHIHLHHPELDCDSKEATAEEKDTEDESASKEKTMEMCLPCLPSCFFDRGYFLLLRRYAFKVVKHRYFDNLVIFCILLSSIALAMDDIYLPNKPILSKILKGVEIFCAIFFGIEMLLKWIGLGWKKYFTNYWCLLDCAIVMISIINLSVSSSPHQTNWSAFRALRTFRALRPLRALSRFKGMKVVVDALIRAIPPILNVFLVCIVFWLIFGILGVNMFGGRFGRCVALPTGDILPLRIGPNESDDFRKSLPPTNATLEEQCSRNNSLLLSYLKGDIILEHYNVTKILPAVRNKAECEKCATMLNTSDIVWNNPKVNFDNVPKAFLALLQLATFNGWMEIMTSAVDATGVEEQPYYEASFYNYLYFCVFIIFGAFFSLNLFIGVIIDNFNQQKIKQKGGEDGVFLTDEQRRYYNAIKKMASKTPTKPIPRSRNRLSNKVYDVVTDRRFEMGVMILIILNLVVMAIEHDGMSEELESTLQSLNLTFILIFLAEAILKLIGLRLYYFTIPWNVFDILVIIVSLIATGLNDVMSQYFVQPTLFRIIRLFRVTRILRLIREAKGIRTLLFALMMSLPALFNIGSLLFLLMSIYAVIGMSQFPYIQKISGIDSILNFETFPSSFLILFQISTSEGWDKFIDPVLLDSAPYCDPDPPDGSPSNCGNSTVGIIFFATYVIISFLIVVNMYIAVILENFEVATRENAEPLTADDFEQFFEVWQRYDDRLTQFIGFEQLGRVLNELDEPLRVPIPNRAFIATSHMKISTDGRVHCMEVIIALIRKVLGDSPELNIFKKTMLESFSMKCKTKEELDDQKTIDSEEFILLYQSVINLQRAFRNYKARKLAGMEVNRIISDFQTTPCESSSDDGKNISNWPPDVAPG